MEKMKRRKIIVICILIAIALALGSCALLHHYFTRFEEGTDVQSVSWLPAGARSVTFYNTIFIQEARFVISEKDFVDFAKTKGFSPEEITRPKEIKWMCIEREKRNRFVSNPSMENYEALKWTITDGLFFEKRYRNNGGYIFAYDRKNSLGYYCWGHH
ncbi:MAG: hypothetical protein LBM92_07695 [Opitutaceae bacterium]|jgi:hypothetical protein|nr:hypothetical protein [Opitutaceae bacterium]